MSEERKKVLEMLAAGKITAAEAERLLDKLASGASNASSAEPSTPSGGAEGGSGARPKYLRVVVDQPGREQVNMRVPLSFLGSGGGLLGILPKHVNERLAECGINVAGFTAMNFPDLRQATHDFDVDVEKGDGKKVRIYCE